MKHHFVKKILEIFLSEGISTYTIQQLAKKVSVSTKTIYLNFKSKDQLLAACLELYYEQFLEEIKVIYCTEKSSVTAFLKATSFILSREFNTNQAFFTDLNRNFKAIQDAVLNKIHPKFPDSSVEILKNGIAEGTVQSDIKPELFMAAFVRLYHSITRESAYSTYGYSTPVILENTIYPLVKGILTEKGLKEYERYISIQ
ncbi:TetR/AcrR family transcriptional regulator [Rubrolithibacter danxiaensis]|uniref:TetR/AcrR family transcriptional regulator n=1 Tax=Rubrolithibacter danxiaensis TaxID=3390805 RepID=UPI003BF86326